VIIITEQEEDSYKSLSERHFTEEEHKLSGLIHDFALSIISKYTPEDLEKLVNSGVVPNLRIYKKIVPAKIRQKVYEKWVENREQIEQFFTYDELLFQAEDHNPEFVPIIKTPNAKRWFEALIKFLEKVIIEDFEG
jgi:hypothetical protein